MDISKPKNSGFWVKTIFQFLIILHGWWYSGFRDYMRQRIQWIKETILNQWI